MYTQYLYSRAEDELTAAAADTAASSSSSTTTVIPATFESSEPITFATTSTFSPTATTSISATPDSGYTTSTPFLASSTSSTPSSTPISSIHPEMLSSSTPEETEEQLGHRNYIGIVIIAVSAAIALLLWFFFARSARSLRQLCRRDRRTNAIQNKNAEHQSHSVVLTPALAPDSPSPPSTAGLDDPRKASTVQLLKSGSTLSVGGEDGLSHDVDVEKGAGSATNLSATTTSQKTKKSFLQRLGVRKT